MAWAINANTVTDLTKWIPSVWSRLVYLEAQAQMLWEKYTGEEGSGMPVIRKRDLFNEAGNTIKISQLANLTGAGVSGESTLQGNEEKLSLREITTSPEWYRHAVADTSKADTQITQDFREKARLALGRWMAKKMDTAKWTAAQTLTAAGFTASVITSIYGGDATSVNTIDAADTFSVETIRQGVNKLEANDIDKIGRVNGADGYYVCLINTHQKYTLIKDSEWLTAQREVGPRTPDNPLFSNILGHYGGAVIATTNQCLRTLNANSPTVYTARALMLGAEALCEGLSEDIGWKEQETDYGFVNGIAVKAAWEDKVMNEKAIVHIVTAAEDPTA